MLCYVIKPEDSNLCLQIINIIMNIISCYNGARFFFFLRKGKEKNTYNASLEFNIVNDVNAS